MAIIAAFLDLEEGHSFALFRLLRRLKTGGHHVCCLGLPYVERHVRDQGFDFIPIMEDLLPPVSWHSGIWQSNYMGEGLRDFYFGPLARGEVLDGAMARLKPGVVILPCQYYIEGLLVYYRYQVPVVYFSASLRAGNRQEACQTVIANLLGLKSGGAEMLELITRAGVNLGSLRDLPNLVLRMPELMAFPEAFDLPGRETDPGVYYIGTGADLERTEQPFEWAGVDPVRPLIYCSLGSQSHLRKDVSRRFLQVVIDAAANHLEWQFIISIGKAFDAGDFTAVPANVILSGWVPQLEVLSRSTLMISHGGFGTVQECILMGVPMVIFPLLPERDMDRCAERVVYHGLGVRGEIEQVSSVELGVLIEEVLRNKSFNERIGLMGEKFRQQDRLEVGVKVIELLVATPSTRAALR